ncbi:uncharacterized protein THITE_2112291 [Thermothielavioides terrestris NRRL 8126]|uniref:C3H1-type domain-containing protein n=1 Tax=Thermothielavioides terrestris (strain ATCC 38088 / NRRL 8126) TaxID=578455 RepID=G2QY76_THETT|nr:uncharacterized protein THITE_2112291 [Thermothielavioides terrestris NRRL 8126]AEO65370.1 hypothetical protein THITE_2112291 [Thermothielavioides terrestris NRRL 8126]
MSYNYGPPPPPPPPAPPSGGPGGYTSYGPPRGGHSGRGRGGLDRGGYHQPHPGYGYGQQPPYGSQNPASYAGPSAQPGYAQPPQHSWNPEHGQHHAPQGAPHAPLPVHNYHPNYAPQLYQHQPPYGAQPPYQTAPQPPYGQPYPAPTPQAGPPAQQWGPPSQSPPSHGAYGGGGRGGRGGYNERGGHKGQLMGPPIRMGFDGGNPQAPPAPVSAPYPYGGPPAPPAPFPPPYQGYPPPGPYMPVPSPFDAHSGHGSRHHGRGGFHHSKSRPQFGGDKNRSRNHNQSKGQTAQTAQTTQTPPIQHQKPDAASAGKKKKRKTNTLGLTPGDESDEDDENEEERLNEMYGAEAPNPQTSSEIAAWIAERRARYPTKSRVEAKKAALKAQNGDANQERSSLELKAEKLRKQLEKVESSIKRKREQQDEGDEMRDLDLGSPSSSNAGSDDEKPESMSSRPQPSNVPPPLKKADPTKHCKYYSTGGTCGKRGKCRFVHDPAVREAALRERELNGGRMTLQQRLILNDKDQEDLAIVETLKYLQDKGILPKKTAGAPASDKSSETATAPQSELPARPAEEGSSNGLPPIPPSSSSADDHTTKYAGWNLSGFGNTGVSSSE